MMTKSIPFMEEGNLLQFQEYQNRLDYRCQMKNANFSAPGKWIVKMNSGNPVSSEEKTKNLLLGLKRVSFGDRCDNLETTQRTGNDFYISRRSNSNNKNREWVEAETGKTSQGFSGTCTWLSVVLKDY